MARLTRCDRCGTPTPIDELDGKPAWVSMGHPQAQPYGLAEAMWSGDEFDQLECAVCYGPGYVAHGFGAVRAWLRAWLRRYDHRRDEEYRRAGEGEPGSVPWMMFP